LLEIDITGDIRLQAPRKGKRLRKRFSGSFVVRPCLGQMAPKALFVAGWAVLLPARPSGRGPNAEHLNRRWQGVQSHAARCPKTQLLLVSWPSLCWFPSHWFPLLGAESAHVLQTPQMNRKPSLLCRGRMGDCVGAFLGQRNWEKKSAYCPEAGEGEVCLVPSPFRHCWGGGGSQQKGSPGSPRVFLRVINCRGMDLGAWKQPACIAKF